MRIINNMNSCMVPQNGEIKMYANYYATKTQKVVLISTDIQGRNVVKKVSVSGKVEGRKVAKENGAQAWNF